MQNWGYRHHPWSRYSLVNTWAETLGGVKVRQSKPTAHKGGKDGVIGVIREILSGSLWGVVVGGVAVGGVSLMSEQPAGNAPPSAPQVSAPASAQGDTTETQAIGSVAEAATQVPVVGTVSVVQAPDADTVVPQADTVSAAAPTAPSISDTLSEPDTTEVAGLTATSEAPVLPNPQSVAPQVPAPERDVVVQTEPAAAIVEDVPDEEVAQPAPDVAVEPAPAQDAPVIADTAPAQAEPADDATIGNVDVSAAQDTSPLIPVTPAAPSAPAESDAVPVTPEAAPDLAIVPVVVTEDEAPIAPVSPDDTAVVVEDDTAPALPTGDATVKVNRLGQSDDTAVVEEEVEIIAEPSAEELPEGTPALLRYAADAQNPDNKPMVSVILVDDGSFDGAITTLQSVPFPVTVMLNPSLPDATKRMQDYRAAGIEVGVLAQLPPQATASDVAVFFEAAFAALPETVAVLDTGEAGLQSGAEVIDQAIAALADGGRGLITVSRGLNTALRTADNQGVPAGTIYRDLDSENQDARVIRRFMDQAAFRARQESGVVLLGRVRGDTISAMILWGAANRASQVAMVPISAILNAE